MSQARESLSLEKAHQAVRQALLKRRHAAGHWEGQLSTSPLSTATAVMALEQVRRRISERSNARSFSHQGLIDRGLAWLANHQNADGGWGDTVKSVSNISTTMLARAVFHATGAVADHPQLETAASRYLERAGGIPAMIARYGRDKTFSVPILTHCALAGLVPWKDIPPLPFELACIPARFYAAIRLPVVSYALPALIAIGQVRHHFQPAGNPLIRMARNASISRSLKILEKIQPPNGGFLEATPLTSFVTMSLAAKGLDQHPVVQRGVEFIVNSVREDGSWPIDTNLATWVTTLSVNALDDCLSTEGRSRIRDWLLGQQYTTKHPYTNADPGGWAWTDLPGGVPDGDDTPGAILALFRLSLGNPDEKTRVAIRLAVNWLLRLQNRDGGWPTFCKGWGTLPFDRSSCDITAHCLRALGVVAPCLPEISGLKRSIQMGFRFLEKQQLPDGSWLPLWFGNQFAADDINPVYGTGRVLAAYRDFGRLKEATSRRAIDWLRSVQNDDGGWGGAAGINSSIEETAIATEALAADPDSRASWESGIQWLIRNLQADPALPASPIGFYFARLWYFEDLYPLIFTASALRRAVEQQAIEQNVHAPLDSLSS